jgi:hypothetical protein
MILKKLKHLLLLSNNLLLFKNFHCNLKNYFNKQIKIINLLISPLLTWPDINVEMKKKKFDYINLFYCSFIS